MRCRQVKDSLGRLVERSHGADNLAI
jgi:hypothetical protein